MLKLRFLMQLVNWTIQFLLRVYSILRVDLFATWAYGCHICPLEFFLFFLVLKSIKKPSGQMPLLYAYAAYKSTKIVLG